MFDVRISLFGLSLTGWIYQRRNEAFSNFWLKVKKGSSSKVSSSWKCQFSWDVSKQRSRVLIHLLSRGDRLQSSLTHRDLLSGRPWELVQRASKCGSFEIITQHYHTVLFFNKDKFRVELIYHLMKRSLNAQTALLRINMIIWGN